MYYKLIKFGEKSNNKIEKKHKIIIKRHNKNQISIFKCNSNNN